jgi:hypothetical protein
MASKLKTPFKYYATIRDIQYGADSLQLMSEIYCLVRDASREGCSTFRPVNISEGNKAIGHISYNGRIWDQPLSDRFCAFTGFLDTSTLLYDNRRVA